MKLDLLYTGTRAPRLSPDAIERVVHMPILTTTFLDEHAHRLSMELESELPITLVMTSTKALEALEELELLETLRPETHRILCVGEKTRARVRARLPSIPVESPPADRQQFEGLVELLESTPSSHLLALELEGTPRLLNRAPGLDHHMIQGVPVYRTEPRAPATLRDEARDHRPLWVVFTSPRGVRGFMAAFPRGHAIWERAEVAALGETTADALREAGWAEPWIAPVPDAEAMIEKLLAICESKR